MFSLCYLWRISNRLKSLCLIIHKILHTRENKMTKDWDYPVMFAKTIEKVLREKNNV